MGILYSKEDKLFCTDYTEIYVPIDYFTNGFATNKGSTLETFGVLYIRAFHNGVEEPIKLFKVPTFIDIMQYTFEEGEIKVNSISIKVMILKYIKDSYVMQRSIPQGRSVAESFLVSMLMGKLPKTLSYSSIINIWLKNIEIAGVNLKVPTKIYEMIIANIYRSPADFKKRFGQVYGKSSSYSDYTYKTGNVRDVVEGLSTFSGMVFEDINRMITSGINNSINEVEEPISPLEKIIHY